VVAALLLVVHPVFRASQVALLPDLPMLVFVLAALCCLQTGLASRGVRQSLRLLGAGVLVGLAVACKLYALALLPAVLVAALLAWRRVGWRAWVGLLVGLCLGGVVFVGLTPPLWSEPAETIRAMTTGHVVAQQGALSGFGSGWDSLRYLAWLPVSLPLAPALSFRSELAGLGPLWSAWLGGGLCALGLLLHIARRRWLPLLFVLSSFALTAWVITRFEPSWLYPRAFLLPAVGAVWLASCVLDALGRPRTR
jgi:4-amino-4-deoxy-L-arabinose transferase-like glycosyltransferase